MVSSHFIFVLRKDVPRNLLNEKHAFAQDVLVVCVNRLQRRGFIYRGLNSNSFFSDL